MMKLEIDGAAGGADDQVLRDRSAGRGAKQGRVSGASRMRLISREELREETGRSGDIKLLFVLGEWQYRVAHIPGSVNLPCTRDLYISEDVLEGIDRDDEIVVYCSNASCWASIAAYYFLVGRGYTNVRRYEGGLVDWESAGYPMDGEMVAGHRRNGQTS